MCKDAIVEELRQRFATAQVARLGTVTAAGAPRLVPITFAVDGDHVVTAVDHKPKSTRQLARLADIAHEPRVAVLADHYNADWARLWWVRADGTAAVAADGPALAHAVELLQAKYPHYRHRPPAGPAIVVTVARWSGWAATDGTATAM